VRGRDGSEAVLPVRYGIETAHPLAAQGYPYANHSAPEPARRWTTFEPRAGHEIGVQTSYARLVLPRPVEAASLECRDAPGSGGWTPIRMMVETLPPPAEEGRFRLKQRWVVTRSSVGGSNMWEEVRSGDEWTSGAENRQETFALYRNGWALPLAYAVCATTEAGTLDEAAAAIRALGPAGLRHVAVVEPGATPTEMHATAPDAFASSGTVARLHRLSPNAAVLTLETQAPSLLVFVERWDPGWRAWLNGREVPVVRVNGIFQGILLPEPGRHVAVFRYRPRSLAPTLAAAVAGLAGAGALALAGGRTRRRKS